MIKETITYEDYNGMTRTEDHYFNLSEAELVDMEMSMNGGLSEMVQRIVASNDNVELYKIFKDVILKSYGQKSLDGKKFIKIDERGRKLVDDFVQTEAYSQFLMSIVTNADKAAAFINGVMPKKLMEKAQAGLPMNE